MTAELYRQLAEATEDLHSSHTRSEIAAAAARREAIVDQLASMCELNPNLPQCVGYGGGSKSLKAGCKCGNCGTGKKCGCDQRGEKAMPKREEYDDDARLFGSQALQHDHDMLTVMYNELSDAMRHLEHEPTKVLVRKKLKHIQDELEELERHHEKHYGDGLSRDDDDDTDQDDDEARALGEEDEDGDDDGLNMAVKALRQSNADQREQIAAIKNALTRVVSPESL